VVDMDSDNVEEEEDMVGEDDGKEKSVRFDG
jgi:hypothetical protein